MSYPHFPQWFYGWWSWPTLILTYPDCQALRQGAAQYHATSVHPQQQRQVFPITVRGAVEEHLGSVASGWGTIGWQWGFTPIIFLVVYDFRGWNLDFLGLTFMLREKNWEWTSSLKPVGINRNKIKPCLNIIESSHSQQQERSSGRVVSFCLKSLKSQHSKPLTRHLHRLSTATQALEGLLGDFPTSLQHLPESVGGPCPKGNHGLQWLGWRGSESKTGRAKSWWYDDLIHDSWWWLG